MLYPRQQKPLQDQKFQQLLIYKLGTYLLLITILFINSVARKKRVKPVGEEQAPWDNEGIYLFPHKHIKAQNKCFVRFSANRRSCWCRSIGRGNFRFRFFNDRTGTNVSYGYQRIGVHFSTTTAKSCVSCSIARQHKTLLVPWYW